MPIETQTSVYGQRLGLTARGGLVVNREKFDGTQSTVGEYITTRIPTASVLTLFTTPFAILAAQGAGLAIVPTRVAIHKPAGTAYAGVAIGEDLVLKWTNAAGAQITSVIETTGFLDQATAQTRIAFPPATVGATAGDLTPAANAAVVAHLLVGDIITGTSDLFVRMWYDIIATTFAVAD